MRFEQTREVLHNIQLFHCQASLFFHRLYLREKDQRVKMLLDYLSRHEKNLEKSIVDYEQGASPKILDTWFKYAHDKDIFKPLENARIAPVMSFEEVLALALSLDQCLIQLYQEMIDSSESKEIKDVFSNLLNRETREKKKLSRSALGLLDI